MKLLSDFHTHTLASGHAYSTINEMAEAAAEKGMKCLGITEHAPGITGTCDPIYFINLKIVPRELFGVKLLLGGELNIHNDGSIQLEEKYLRQMDFRIAGIHSLCYTTKSPSENTEAVLKAMADPYVDAISHPDDGTLGLDYVALVEQSIKYSTFLEVNNNALVTTNTRLNSLENAVYMLKLLKKRDMPVLVDSDAHFYTEVGRCDRSAIAIELAEFPDELIVNNHPEILMEVLRKKHKR